MRTEGSTIHGGRPAGGGQSLRRAPAIGAAGGNRVLGRHAGQWAEAIVQLASAAELRTQMGQPGRAYAAQRYSVSGWQNWFAEFLDGLALRNVDR